MSQNARSLKSDDKMTISTKLYPPLEHVDQPLPNNVILLDSNDNIFNYDRDGITSSWSVHSNWSSIQQDDGRASSLDSWGEDEFDRQAARRVLDMFAEIDLALYEGKRLDIPLIDAECTDWRAMFPHFRLTGRRIRPQSRSTTPHRPPSVTVASTRNRKKKKKRKLRSSLPSTSKQAEEIFAQHGTLEDGEDGVQSPSKLKSARSQESDNFRAAVVQELTARHLWSDVMTCISPLIDSYRPELPETNRSSPAVKRHSVPPHAIEKLSGQSRRSTQANVVTFLAEYQSPVPRRVQSLGAPKQRTVRQPIPSNSRMISAVKLQPRKLRPIRTTASDPSAYPTAAARKQTTSKGWSRLPPIDSSRSPRVQLSVAPRPTSAHSGRVQFKVSVKKERSRTFDDIQSIEEIDQFPSLTVISDLPLTATSGKSRKRTSRKDLLREIPRHTAQRASARKNNVRPSFSASPMKRSSIVRMKSPFRI